MRRDRKVTLSRAQKLGEDDLGDLVATCLTERKLQGKQNSRPYCKSKLPIPCDYRTDETMIALDYETMDRYKVHICSLPYEKPQRKKNDG